ncbi:MAG TPA: tetratricopeptide repeat protein, partial [Brumimicrobium sp.]|nr:tetratricopeptide repeat protein [Brumimicrobium sp.]
MKRLGLFILFFIFFTPESLVGQHDFSDEIAVFNETKDVDTKMELLYEFAPSLIGLYGDSVLYFIRNLNYEGIKNKRKDAITMSNFYMSHYLIKNSFYEQAEGKLNSVIEYYNLVENDTMLALSHNLLGNIHYSRGNMNNAEKEYERALYYGERKSGREVIKMIPMQNLARIAIRNKEYDIAESLLREYIRFHHTPEGSIQDLASGYGLLGEFYLNQGDYENATDNFIRSMEYGLTVGTKSTVANAYTNLGIAEFFAENLKRSKEYFKLALAVRIEDGNALFIAASYYNLGDYFNGIGEIDSALVNYEKSASVSEESGVLRIKKDALEQIGLIYESLEENEKQITVLKEIIEVQNKIHAQKREEDSRVMNFNYEQTMLELEGVNQLREESLAGKVKRYQSVFNNWLFIS